MKDQMMRAVVVDDYGAAPHLVDMAAPAPGPGEVQVRIQASSVNSFDSFLAVGGLKGMYEHCFPIILGKDFAGTVSGVGDGVSEFRVGDAVFGVIVRPRLTDGGGFAQYATTSATFGIAPRPTGFDINKAGLIGLAGSTAAAAVDALGACAEGTVLVSGATGGVGVFALQMLATRSARVLATATPGRAADLVRELGAHTIIDYRNDVVAQVKELQPKGIDAVLHFAGDGLALADLIVDGGAFASARHVGADQLASRNISAHAVMAQPDRQVLDGLAARVSNGRLRVPIAGTHQLEDVPDALAQFAQGKLGKLAISVDLNTKSVS